MFRWNLLCFSLRHLPLVLSPGTTKKSLAPSSLHPLFRNLHTLIKFDLGLVFSRLNSPSSISLYSQERCSSPFIIAPVARSLSYWGARNWTQCSLPHQARTEAKTTLLQPRVLLAFFAVMAHYWLMFKQIAIKGKPMCFFLIRVKNKFELPGF